MQLCGGSGRELPLDDPPTWAKLLAFTDLPQAATITWAPAPAPTPQIDTVVFQVSALTYTDMCAHSCTNAMQVQTYEVSKAESIFHDLTSGGS